MSVAKNLEKPEKTKKRSGCLKKALLILLTVSLVGWVSHRIRYATDDEYARQHDTEQAQLVAERKVREEQKAEEKRLADARKVEEERIAAAKKEEERIKKEAEEAARVENRHLEDEFFARAVQARIAAEERANSGNPLWSRYTFSDHLNAADGNEADREAQRFYSETYKYLAPHIRNDGNELINFKGGVDSRKQRNDLVQSAIINLLRAAKVDGISESVKAQVLWLIGRLYFEYDHGTKVGGDSRETGTEFLLQAAELGSLPAATYVGAHGKPSEKADEYKPFLKKAAEQGYLPAQCQYALSNYGPYKTASEAWEFALNAASHDYPQAQFIIQLLYESAKKEDPSLSKEMTASFDEESGKWLLLSAQNGYALAQAGMDKFSIATSDTEREKWLRLAAEQDYPEAQLRLGILLAHQKKEDEAMRWIFTASRNDDLGALKLLKESTPKMKKEVSDLIRKEFGASHFLLNQDNPFHVYDRQKINRNLDMLYLRDLKNNRVVLLMISPPFGSSSFMKVVSHGTGSDPRWQVAFDGSDSERLNVLLISDSDLKRLQVYYDYQQKFQNFELQ